MRETVKREHFTCEGCNKGIDVNQGTEPEGWSMGTVRVAGTVDVKDWMACKPACRSKAQANVLGEKDEEKPKRTYKPRARRGEGAGRGEGTGAGTGAGHRSKPATDQAAATVGAVSAA